MSVKIIKDPDSGVFATTVARTKITQREKLETTMKNLCSCLGIKTIYSQLSARNSTFYRPEGSFTYQSASNTILELSERLVSNINKKS